MFVDDFSYENILEFLKDLRKNNETNVTNQINNYECIHENIFQLSQFVLNFNYNFLILISNFDIILLSYYHIII